MVDIFPYKLYTHTLTLFNLVIFYVQEMMNYVHLLLLPHVFRFLILFCIPLLVFSVIKISIVRVSLVRWGFDLSSYLQLGDVLLYLLGRYSQ